MRAANLIIVACLFSVQSASAATAPATEPTRPQATVQSSKDLPCPTSFAAVKQKDVPRIASCLPLQKEVCRNVCGVRYDTLDVRNFNQTGGKPGLLCQDTSMEATKNGASFASDPQRASCLETHEGVYKWCTNYNKTVNKVAYGAFVQCQGLIK